MAACYRMTDAMHPEMYCASMAGVLSEYSADIIEKVTDPRTGVPRRLKWLPSVAEVVEACEHERGLKEALEAREETKQAAKAREEAAAVQAAERRRDRAARRQRAAEAGMVVSAPGTAADLPDIGQAAAKVIAAAKSDPEASRFWSAYPGTDWTARQRSAAEKVWSGLSDDERRRVLEVLPEVAARWRASGRHSPKPADWLTGRSWAAPASADAGGRVWVVDDTPEGRAWSAFDRLADGGGLVHWDDARRCRGAWRVAAVPPALGIAIGAVPPVDWVEIEAGSQAHAAWRGRLIEACRAVGAACRLKSLRRVSRLGADGVLRTVEVWTVPMALPPARSLATPAAIQAEAAS